ncbi:MULTISPECIES: malto-oligosyltrehalose synthase [unclassified Streptomyces]|uniref:malto-oligosyltrehalose synthase n=1 Tax=unclassified Streptomyces TaxID=2593676 RepID=UPI0006FD3AE0|nr:MULTISPECIES: malto-oligosyltrehalose synthase [unclassified Streptomyces]KQX55770.1 malto-oligosyltrehalose synthase [Streptomyces sp. Root1304]KRA96367.1 malto-oligosyltrehalose synthase [Streptomyces sp. Root66D1]
MTSLPAGSSATRPVPPTATYRLQLQPEFPFAAAGRAVPHLAGLGISHLHLSPVLEAVPGSTHGYDVTDHRSVRAELGGEEGLRALAATARAHGLGLVVDLVPNHMAASPTHNHALRAVLGEGPDSPYARWFDIDWRAGDGRLLLPVLPARLPEVRDRLRVSDGALHLDGQEFPLRPGTEGLPLDELLDAQWYRLGWWRLARTELNYRRFFTISELIGVRVEDPEVFEATHAKIVELVRDGVVEGLRIDHPDGLADPQGYLDDLAAATGGRCWTVVEKILTGPETLPAAWPVAGTTGYDALHRVDGVFTDPDGTEELTGVYRDFTAKAGDRGGHWEATGRRAAYEVVGHDLAAETAALTRLAERICAADPALRDHAPWALRTAIRELLVRVPVYRSYRTGGEEVLTPEAARGAKAAFAVPEEAAAVDVVRDLALGLRGDGPEHRSFRARFAQTSSALRAKSVEDTAFYRYVPLLSANEVGGDAGRPAVSVEEFHAYCGRISRDWPDTGTVLTTHDTKRSADVRAGIAVLSQCPRVWAELLAEVAGVPAPDPHVAWTAWQTAFGFGAPDPERLGPAILKSVREAGLRTSWTEPDAGYERAVAEFAAAGPGRIPLRAASEAAFALEPHIRAHALGALLTQLTMPGVPELYQNTERAYRALVDPDNRAPFAVGPDDDHTALVRAALKLRRERPEVFAAAGSYTPLTAEGPAAAHCLAFARSAEVVTAVTRLPLRLGEAGGWQDTELVLPEGRWADVLDGVREFTGGAATELKLAELFAERPVALLARIDG